MLPRSLADFVPRAFPDQAPSSTDTCPSTPPPGQAPATAATPRRGGGRLGYVGPPVDTHAQEKPLSTLLREINPDLLTCVDFDPEAEGGEPKAK